MTNIVYFVYIRTVVYSTTEQSRSLAILELAAQRSHAGSLDHVEQIPGIETDGELLRRGLHGLDQDAIRTAISA